MNKPLRNDIFFPTSEIESVDYSINGDYDIAQKFSRKINRSALYQGEIPITGGPCSLTLGTVNYSYLCMTCQNGKKLCPGHNGHIKLRFPLFSPLFVKQIVRCLKKICHQCGSYFIPQSSTGKQKTCIICNHEMPKITEGTSPLFLYFQIGQKKQTVYPFQVKMIFQKVSAETAKKLTFAGNSHPTKLIISYLTIPSIIIRADVKYISGGRSNNDALTTTIFHIIQINQQLPHTAPDIITKDLEEKYIKLAERVYQFIRGTSISAQQHNNQQGSWTSIKMSSNSDKTNSLSDRVSLKAGRVRSNILGRRVINIARATISCGPRIKIDEVMIPLIVAKSIFFPETFKPYNRERLMTYFLNGSKNYPGSWILKKKSDGIKWNCDVLKEKKYVPENGDVIYRNVITGDIVMFNRMPTLTYSSMSAHRVVVNLKEPNSYTLRMNTISTILYNADFDGDAMQIIFAVLLMSQIENMEISAVKKWFINYKDGKNAITMHEDIIICAFEFSQHMSKFIQPIALRYFGNTTFIPNILLTDVQDGKIQDLKNLKSNIYTGNDLVSLILPKNINFNEKTQYYEPDWAPYIKYGDHEKRMVVINSKIKTGVIDKNFGNIFGNIYFKYNATVAIQALFNLQQITLEHPFVKGISISIKDFLISKSLQYKLREQISAIILDSDLITTQYINGNLIPPIGKTLEQFFEEKQANCLTTDYAEYILKSIDTEKNGLYRIFASGTKGKPLNMQMITSALGQFMYKEKRCPYQFSFRRTSPYFCRCDISAQSRGFIPNSFMDGLTVWEFFYSSMQARVDLLNKSFLISDSGDQGRISIKNLEQLKVDNMRFITTYGEVITQYMFGADGFDITHMQTINHEELFCSDQKFKNLYFMQHSDSKIQSVFTDFYELQLQMRNQFKTSFLKQDSALLESTMRQTIKTPQDFRDILRDQIVLVESFELSKTEKNELDIVQQITLLREFIQNLPYIYSNERNRQLKKNIFQYQRDGMFMVILNILLSMTKEMFQKVDIHILQESIYKIYYKAKQSLLQYGTSVGIISAQAFTEPLTQAALNSIHMTGRKTTIAKVGINRIREIFSAKAKEKCNNPMMILPLKIGITSAKAAEIKNKIERLTINDIHQRIDILFENVTQPTNQTFIEDKQIMNSYMKIKQPPKDFTTSKTFCIRIEFDKKNILTKGITTQDIIYPFERNQDYYYIISTMSHEKLFIRIYLRQRLFSKSKENTKQGKKAQDKDQFSIAMEQSDIILKTVIRGIPGIYSCFVHDIDKFIENKPEQTSNQSEYGEIKKFKRYYIVTIGINFEGVFCLQGLIPEINYNEVTCDNIDEIYYFFGAAAARNKLISEILSFEDLSKLDTKHFELVADEMLSQGGLGKISRTGANKRINNPLHNIANFGVAKAIEESARTCAHAKIEGISPYLLVGDFPRTGTNYNKFMIDVDFVKANKTSIHSIIENI